MDVVVAGRRSGRREEKYDLRVRSGLTVLLLMITACTGTASITENESAENGAATTQPSQSPTTLPSPTTGPTTTTTLEPTTTEPTPETAPPFEPSASDVLLNRKRLGGQFAQSLLTYGADATPESHAEALIDNFDMQDPTELVDLVSEAMAVGSDSVGSVRYAQMGGNRLTKASLMVWVDVERLSPANVRSSESRVVDVRVALIDDVWTVERLASAGGPAVERPDDLSELAASVVDSTAISMPDSARWDIYSGHTTEAMLERMLEIADFTDYGVLVLNRGHPYRVFATESVSRHSVGNAVDVYSVGGELVVNSRSENSPAWTLARKLYDDGMRSLGSPWAFDGFGGRSFTDDVHQDHLHITS